MRAELERICEVIATDKTARHNLRDPKDNHVLEAAIAVKCDFVITGDKDLLELISYQGIAIIRPSEFLEAVGSA